MGQQKTGENNILTGIAQAGGATVAPPRPAGTKPRQGKTSAKITHDQIARLAHEMWVRQGCRHGRDQENWFEAERQLKTERARK